MPSPSRLERLIASYRSVLVGYSGGVDSALLAVVARRTLGHGPAVAAIGISPSYPAAQRKQALEVAHDFDVNLVQIETDEMRDPNYVANPTNRCYFCKHELWTKLLALARERDIDVVVDGTNADDLREHRPGLAAAAELGIRSPLAEARYTKQAARAEARTLGIPIWAAPAAPCLSSRVMYGLPVTSTRLRQVEEGEEYLRCVGVLGDLRVRHRGNEARIEVSASQFERVREHRQGIAAQLLALGFARVTLDLRGYRRGSMLATQEPELELLAERS